MVHDPRAWHRGTPNHSARPRPMIGVGYSQPGVHHEPLVVPDSTWARLAPADRGLLAASRRWTLSRGAHRWAEPTLRLEPHWTNPPR